MPSYGFSFRASTRQGGGAGRLYLRVVHGGDSRSVTTAYKILPEEWDAHRRRLSIPYGRSTRARQLADMEAAMQCDLRRLEAVIQNLESEGGAFTVDRIMERYRNVTVDNTLIAFTEKLATELECSGNRRTAKAYRTAAYRLQLFSGLRRLGFESITAGLVADFQQTLKSEGCSMNTVSFYMRTLRAVYNKAVIEGRISRPGESPFARVYTGVPTTRKLALSSADLGRLSAFDPTLPDNRRYDDEELPEHLAQALAMFLFCYHARGMCFVDLAYLKKADVKADTIHYRRSKTGQAIEVKVLPPMRRIIDWFSWRTGGSRYLFPIIDESCGDAGLQYESGLRLQNMHLKKIARICGVSRNLSTHSARHSWATVAKNAGLPLAVISEGLGHSNQRTTEIYLASLERSVLDQASQVVSEAIGRGIGPIEAGGPRAAAKKKSPGGLHY